MAFGAILGGILGGLVTGTGEAIKERDKAKEKRKLKEEQRKLRLELGPIDRQLREAYAPGGFYERALRAQGSERASVARVAEDRQARALGSLQGGRRSGAFLHPRRTGSTAILAETELAAPLESLKARVGQQLTRKGLSLDRRQYPELRNRYIGFGEAARTFGAAYDEGARPTR